MHGPTKFLGTDGFVDALASQASASARALNLTTYFTAFTGVAQATLQSLLYCQWSVLSREQDRKRPALNRPRCATPCCHLGLFSDCFGLQQPRTTLRPLSYSLVLHHSTLYYRPVNRVSWKNIEQQMLCQFGRFRGQPAIVADLVHSISQVSKSRIDCHYNNWPK